MSAYNWDLGINVPVKSQEFSDNYQKMRIMLAVLRFKSDGQEVSTIEWQELKNRCPSFFVHK